MSHVALWGRAFAVTFIVELFVAVPLLERREAIARRVTAVIAAQLATHPSVWFILPELGLGRSAYMVLAESWAVGIELLFYRLVFGGLSWPRALAISALANGASLAAGVFIR